MNTDIMYVVRGMFKESVLMSDLHISIIGQQKCFASSTFKGKYSVDKCQNVAVSHQKCILLHYNCNDETVFRNF